MLLIASTAPLNNKILIQTVLVLELVRGIFMDVYWLSRGYYDSAPYIIWIVIHLVIIVSGWRLLQKAEASSDAAPAKSSWQPG